MVEQVAVNDKVLGSSPSRGARKGGKVDYKIYSNIMNGTIKKKKNKEFFFIFSICWESRSTVAVRSITFFGKGTLLTPRVYHMGKCLWCSAVTISLRIYRR